MKIVLKKVAVHNLKKVDLELPEGKLILFTGVSGSGKSSMAFDTLFALGQRRYIESLSPHARRYLGEMSKPDVESVSGLSPTIAIEQKTAGKNPRSTVGTMTEIYDFLRVLYARLAICYCPDTGERVTAQSKEKVYQRALTILTSGEPLLILAPFAKEKKGEFKEDFAQLLHRGFMRARVDGKMQELSEESSLDKKLSHTIDIVIDRFTFDPSLKERLIEGMQKALEMSGGECILLQGEREELFSTHAYSAKTGVYYPALEPSDFSFNSPSGMCPRCHGLGRTQSFVLKKIIDPSLSISQDCCKIASSASTVRFGNIYRNLSEIYRFSLETPWEKLSKKAQEVFLYGTEKKWTPMHFIHPERPVSWTEYVHWKGVIPDAMERFAEAKSDLYRKKMQELMEEARCTLCQGSGCKPYPSAAKFADVTLYELTQKTVGELLAFFAKLSLPEEELVIAEELLKEIQERLSFLQNVGLSYLTLDRRAPTLSGGEAQRVRLAAHLGSSLVGVTYILDEPSIGLHPRDNQKLITTLLKLRDRGNTLIVVEHDEETIRTADHIVDFGPGAGNLGGEIIVNGTLEELLNSPTSLTGKYLNGDLTIAQPTERRTSSAFLELHGATLHNLQNCSLSLPLGLFIAVTGLSGSGKSSLIMQTLYPALTQKPGGPYTSLRGAEQIDKVIAIDQSPIGKNSRSTPATYIKLFDDIRALFSQIPEAKSHGYNMGRFSFNVEEGACPRCQGMGQLRIDMDFMEDQWMICPHCQGKRYDPETLSITYKGKNIEEVLRMTVQEASLFFAAHPAISRKLRLLEEVGMGYMTLGQPSNTLSGGEAQRIKLAKELSKSLRERTLYILDEPTTGLHFHDVNALLGLLHRLVNKGHTVLVIEHNMEVVKTADYVIDMGPEAGSEGGKIVATGTPEELQKKKTATGEALRALFQGKLSSLASSWQEKSAPENIVISSASQNNLQSVSATIPRGKMSVCCGVSGSGKSSFAFDTIYAEGQRRYVESLSAYARQFVEQMAKPKVESLEGLSPTIAIEQKLSPGNPRSTIGTQTEIYDYLRILYASLGTAYCPETGELIEEITPARVVEKILAYPEGEKIVICAPLEIGKQETWEAFVDKWKRRGFLRIRLNGTYYEFDDPIPFERKKKNQIALVIDRTQVSSKNRSRLFEAVENSSLHGEKKVIVVRETGEEFFNLSFAVQRTGKSYQKLTPKNFSFNHPEGMCPACLGLGTQYGANFAQNEEIMSLSLRALFSLLWTFERIPLVENFFKKFGISTKTSLSELSLDELDLVMNGSREGYEIEGATLRFRGIQPVLAIAAKSAKPEHRAPLVPLLQENPCVSCQGSRLGKLASHVRLEDLPLASLTALPLTEVGAFIEKLQVPPHLEEVLSQVKSRLQFLLDVGVGYLSLDRKAPTLSNGEAQRIRLARQLGAELTGILYVLDEPTIGLHPHDHEKLFDALDKLKKLQNTLLLVEHDPATLQKADFLLEFGPKAGIHGGKIIAQGSYEELLANPDSLTGAYLSGRKKLPPGRNRGKAKNFFEIENATIHNLKNISLSLPLGRLIAVSGVSGSGKSTLMHEVIRPKAVEFFDKVIVVDQDPLGHTSRSDVGTYCDLLPLLRSFYASLPAAKAKGLFPRHFSTNHPQGMCSTCYGFGYKKVEMLFLPPVYTDCDGCHGMRLQPQSLLISYKNIHFGKLLQLSLEETHKLFSFLPSAERILSCLLSVGLGYLTLGQQVATLSGGEAQRIKLAKELSKRSTKNTLYLLDEPTTGLHPEDIAQLLHLLQSLVDKGSTCIFIEHNVDVIAAADHIIDLGPGPGALGGKVVAQGSLKEIIKNPKSLTGKYLLKRMF